MIKTMLMAGSCALALAATSAEAASFMYTGGEQTFTVATTGLYQIDVYGAQGGGALRARGVPGRLDGGRGVGLRGTFNLTAGDILYLFVGGQGGEGDLVNDPSLDFTAQAAGGGGGSSFVTLGPDPLIVAGGGGGANGTEEFFSGTPVHRGDALTGEAGGYGGEFVVGYTPGPESAPIIQTFGVYGDGGANSGRVKEDEFSRGPGGAGGGGFYGDGESYGHYNIGDAQGGRALINGASGGPGGCATQITAFNCGGLGGYGGGGGGGFTLISINFAGGGGGGWSGGAGGFWRSEEEAGWGYGGGSYNAGSDQAFLGYRLGDGLIEINAISVPEPSTWAMMLTGFGFTGFLLRRRRLKTA